MKKSILTLFVALSSLTMSAQNQGGRFEFNPEQMATRRVEQIKKACNTTEEQDAKLKEYYLKQAKEMKERMDSLRAANENRFPNREHMAERQKAERIAISEILTEDQMAAYDKMIKERPQRRPGGGNRPGGHRPGGFGGGNFQNNDNNE